MATELSAVFYFDEQPQPALPFTELVRAVATHSTWRSNWQGFKVVAKNLRTVIAKEPGPMTSEQVLATAPLHDAAQNRISVNTALQCWRFTGTAAEPEAVPAILEATGAEYGGTDPRVRGAAMLSITNMAPFNAIVDPIDAQSAERNRRVEENLKALTSLLGHCVEATRPSSMKLYDDSGMFLPFNAHLAYFRDEKAVLQDLAWISELWTNGLRAYQLPPLGDRFADTIETLHPRRTESQRKELWQRLARAIPTWPAMSTKNVRQLLKSGPSLDCQEVGSGFMLLNWPHFADAFIDGLYVDLTETAAQTESS
jgi:hypothetical protein